MGGWGVGGWGWGGACSLTCGCYLRAVLGRASCHARRTPSAARAPALPATLLAGKEVQHPPCPYLHPQEKGYNAVEFYNVYDCWARDIASVNADSTVVMTGATCLCLFMTGAPRPLGRRGPSPGLLVSTAVPPARLLAAPPARPARSCGSCVGGVCCAASRCRPGPHMLPAARCPSTPPL